MKLENYITHGEYLDTIELAYKVKKIYGINAYFLFKKICMVAACKAGTTDTNNHFTTYITYSIFLCKCSDHIFHMRNMDSLFNIRMKYEIGDDFFGVPVAYIYDFNVLELDEFLTKPSGIKMKRPLEAWDY